MNRWMWVGLLALAGCPDEEEKTAATTDETTEGEDYTEFCDTYCNQGLADVDDAGCENQPLSTDDDVDSCVATCLAQTSSACAEVSVTFWQCTLDEYPGNFTCDANGRVAQPDSCSAEQQAVLDCFNG